MGTCSAPTINDMGLRIDLADLTDDRVAATIDCLAKTIDDAAEMIDRAARDDDRNSLLDTCMRTLITRMRRLVDHSAAAIDRKPDTIHRSATNAHHNTAMITNSSTTIDDSSTMITHESRTIAFNTHHVDFATRCDEKKSSHETISARSGTPNAIMPSVRASSEGRDGPTCIIIAAPCPTMVRQTEGMGCMNRVVSRRLDMAVRVRDFCDTNPSTDPSFVSVLGRLKDAIDRMVALGSKQVTGILSRHASIVNRQQIRRRLRDDLLRHLVTIAQDASVEQPGLGNKFEVPGFNLSSARFHAASKAMLELGLSEKEMLVKHGLSGTLLDDLAAAVTEYEGSITATNTSRTGHITAGADLTLVSEEILLLVGMMDGINRYRFRNDQGLLVAWDAAKHVLTGPQPKSEAPAGPGSSTPAEPGTGGQPGEVKPAA